jgi:hypothetical protein
VASLYQPLQYLSLALITDRASVPGAALVLILASIFKVTEISDCTHYILVHVYGQSFKKNSSLAIHHTSCYQYFLDTYREHLHHTADTIGDSDSTVKVLSVKILKKKWE